MAVMLCQKPQVYFGTASPYANLTKARRTHPQAPIRRTFERIAHRNAMSRARWLARGARFAAAMVEHLQVIPTPSLNPYLVRSRHSHSASEYGMRNSTRRRLPFFVALRNLSTPSLSRNQRTTVDVLIHHDSA